MNNVFGYFTIMKNKTLMSYLKKIALSLSTIKLTKTDKFLEV